MTLPLERARSRRPVTWLTLIGVLLLPVVIGGILVAALYNPVERLDGMRAAIVNEDEPVTINGQYVPLGRQLTAGLVKGSDALPSNLDWTISNTDDAATGLADGTYDAVITIPANFSAAATSTAPGSTPERATITAQTAPDSRIVDEAITSQVASAAASVLGQQLSTVYLENVFLGFTTLGDQLGTAADGAHQLADGATKTQSGAVSLADGVRQLATGAGALSGGLDQLSSGAGQLASGVTSYAAGAHRSADGLGQLSNGLNQLVQPSAALAAGMQQFADQAQGISVPQRVIDAAQNVADNSATVQQNAEATVAQLQQLAAECATSGSPAEFCAALTRAADEAEAALPTVTDLIGNSQQIADGLGQINQLPAATAQLAAGSAGISQGIAGLAGGLSQAAAGANELATGADGLAAGAQGIADGAAQSATGAGQLASG
ncbi:YhgE/Pip family protein, partial [Microbacterium flavum]